MHAHEEPSNSWNAQHVFFQPCEDALFFHTKCPINPTAAHARTDQSFSKYADDMVKMVVAPAGASFEEILELASTSLGRLDEELALFGYAQNRSKMIAVLCLSGKGSRRVVHDIANGSLKPPFTCRLTVKSLGSMVTHDWSAGPEVQARIAGVRKAFYRRAGLWGKPGLPYKVRRLMLICDVQNSALSGLEAYCVTDHQCATLDKAILKVARVSMRGAAVTRDSSGAITDCLTSREVFRFWRLGTSATELCIRRVKWLQQMAQFPADHRLVFNSIFGTCRGELLCGFAPGVEEMRITSSASPWALQAKRDIMRLEETDEGSVLLQEVGDRLMMLFADKDLAQRFAAIDPSQLRAQELSVSIGRERNMDTTCMTHESNTDLPLQCGLCNVKLPSKQSLLLHFRTAHDLRKCSHLCAYTNQCFVCLETFSDRVKTSRHIQATFDRGYCCASRTHNMSSALEPSSLACPIPNCEHQSENLLDSYSHLLSKHFSWLHPSKACYHAANTDLDERDKGASQTEEASGRRRRRPGQRFREGTSLLSQGGQERRAKPDKQDGRPAVYFESAWSKEIGEFPRSFGEAGSCRCGAQPGDCRCKQGDSWILGAHSLDQGGSQQWAEAPVCVCFGSTCVG